MRIAETRHKRSAFPVENADFGILLKRILVGYLTHGHDFLTWSRLVERQRMFRVLALTFNQHITAERELARCLENFDVEEEDDGFRMCAGDFVFLGLEVRVELDGVDVC